MPAPLMDTYSAPDLDFVSSPEAIEFPTDAHPPNDIAHAFYYAPFNPDFQAPDDERPPGLKAQKRKALEHFGDHVLKQVSRRIRRGLHGKHPAPDGTAAIGRKYSRRRSAGHRRLRHGMKACRQPATG